MQINTKLWLFYKHFLSSNERCIVKSISIIFWQNNGNSNMGAYRKENSIFFSFVLYISNRIKMIILSNFFLLQKQFESIRLWQNIEIYFHFVCKFYCNLRLGFFYRFYTDNIVTIVWYINKVLFELLEID